MKRFLPLLAALALTTPFWDLGRPVWEVDDARYAEIPREMAESGNWLTPSLNYVDYVEKPPLIYWLGMISYRMFGVSEAAGRLPLAVLAVIGMLGAGWLGGWLYGPRVGMYAVVMLGTCAQYFGLSHIITPDMSVSVWLLWTTAFILRALRRPEDARWAGAGAWLCAALAFLSKGLIALVFPGAWAAALLMFFPNLRKGLKPLILNWGLLAFVFIIGGWFAAMEMANPGFCHVFIIEHHFQRYLTAKYNRVGGWWFFIPVDIVGTLPWTPLVLTAVLAPLIRWSRADARDRQLALWCAGVFVFFSKSSSMLITYLLPIFAHQAVLAGRLLTRLASDRVLRRWTTGLSWFFAGLFAVAFGALYSLPLWLPKFAALPPDAIPAGIMPPALTLLAALTLASVGMALAKRGPAGENAFLRVAVCALVLNGAMAWGASLVNDRVSVKDLALDLNARLAALPADRPVKIYAYDVYLHGIPFYTGRPVDVVNWLGEMHYAKRFERFKHRFADDDDMRALPVEGQTTFVTVRSRQKQQFLALSKQPPRRVTAYGAWLLIEY